MNYIFDTNIIIGFLKNDKSIVSKLKIEKNINTSVITIGEMSYGAKNSNNPLKNMELYNEFFKYCNIFEITRKTSEYYADIRFELKKVGKPIPENDIWIAAIAKENDMVIVTRDKHLKDIDFIATEEW